MGAFTIGELAKRSGASRDALRFYEREGLLPPPPRSESGYRQYRLDDVERVRFIREAQKIGLTLDDVRELLSLRAASTAQECERVKARIQKRLDAIDGKIAELQAFRDRLGESLERCGDSGEGGCPIVLDLSAAARRTRAD